MKKISNSIPQLLISIRRQIPAATLILLTACSGGTEFLDENQLDQDIDIAAATASADLYLIIGQSNSAGRDINFDPAGADAPSSEVLLFTCLLYTSPSPRD